VTQHAFVRCGPRIAVTGLVAWLLALPMSPAVLAQQANVTPNYKDADIRQVIEAVGAVTGRNFVLDPRVKAQVTMLSSAPMTPDAFYEAFLSILSVYGFVAVPSGNVVKILPDANARQFPGAEMTADGGRLADDLVTRVIAVSNVAAAQLVPILRPLIPQYGHLAAHGPSNLLIISDRAANVDRMVRIIQRIDQESSSDFEVLRLENASAAEVVRVVTALGQGTKTEGAAPAATVVADERTNSVLISGDKNERLRLRTLVAHLDTPLQEGGDTRVRYLRYADAKDLATKLQAQYQKGAAAAAGDKAGGPPGEKGDIVIWADEPTNALVITAPPKVMKAMMAVIDKVDIRRMQVLVESLVVEVSADKAAELGVNWAVADSDFENVVGVTRFDAPNTGGTGIIGLAGAIEGGDSGSTDPVALAAAFGKGLTLGVGRISDSGTSFVALINALSSDADTNIVGTPVLVTMDNEEAEIKVGQEVPFVTGQYTNTGATGGATSVNPFQTIEREQVGLTLKITPQINEGDAVLLKIEQELSQLQANVRGAADLITSNRSIATSVIVEDQGTLVLGGLIQEDLTETQQRIPLLGSIPFLGQFFRMDSTNKKKTNLMVFIKPTILRDDAQAAFETNAKYNYVRNEQLRTDPDKVRLMPGESRPVLPPIAPAAPPVIDLRQLRISGETVGQANREPDASPAGQPGPQ
jgi:general secretion pathway protein D